ncbi:MAG: AraC family transcriptional regulator [Bacteroidota bacterium]|nr:AraC family transcriptional regulator [Bacteroidota bacterium]
MERFTSPRHYHTEFELTLIPSGYGKLFVGNSIVDFKENDIFMFAPHLSHCFQNPKDFDSFKQRAKAIVIQFQEGFLGEKFIQSEQAISLSGLFERSKYGIQFQELNNEIKQLFYEINKKNGLDSLGYLMVLLQKLSQWKTTTLLNVNVPDKNINAKDYNRMDKVFEYIADNLTGEIQFIKAASIAHMQEAAFSRYFKRRTQKTFSQYVNELRISHAKKLLLDTDKSITEICFESGFENMSYFNRQFKYLTHQSPSEYKRVSIKY